MSGIFVLCTPHDYDWIAPIVQQLRQAGLTLYLEPLDASPAIQAETAQALYSASAMLVVISQESVFGESAPVFEQWWRPFVTEKRPIVVCIPPDAPSGAEYWMPFNLATYPRVDFSAGADVNLLQSALKNLGKPRMKPAPTQVIPQPLLTAHTQAQPLLEAPKPFLPLPPPPTPIPLPQTPLPNPPALAIEHARLKRNSRQLLGILVGVPLLVGALAMLWWVGLDIADSYGETTALIAISLASIAGLGAAGALMLIKARRNRPSPSEIIDTSTPNRRRRFEVFLEVIASAHNEDLHRVFTLTQFNTLIGRGSDADIQLRDNTLQKSHCAIRYHRVEGRYYVENLTNANMLVYDTPLYVGEMRPLENGDLLVLGETVVLQFRVIS